MLDEVATATGTPNIALIKYWGKRDEKLILPQNSSISITLDETLSTKTSVLFSKRLKEDSLYINEKQIDLSDGDAKERFEVVNKMRKLARIDSKVLIVSQNSFPTASGLASSSSGVATLVYALSTALGLKLSPKELSIMARQGSGSSCRSIFGGFVVWNRGKNADGSDSYAEQIANAKHWPEIRVIIGIASEAKKKVSSRAGMKQTVANGILYKSRLGYVGNAVEKMIRAIKDKDFKSLAEITMRDSNNMHATMLDTWPPILYLNDISKGIVYKMHELNEAEGESIAAYTFDAGPNAFIITTEKYRPKVVKALREVDGVSDVLEAKVGEGPRIIKDSLIDTEELASKGSR